VSVAAARRARERERHTHEVLEAALRVFARRGFHGAGMAEIAREAEFSVGTLYNLFGSKEALFERLLLEHIGALEAEIVAAIESSTGTRECLEAIAIAKARVAARRRAFLAIFASSVPGSYTMQDLEMPSVLAAHARVRAQTDAVVEEGARRGDLRSDLPHEVIALVFDAATRAHNLERVVKSEGEVDEAEVRALVRALLDGFGAARR
jgi:AcrR family transcriptional regulator